MSCKQSAAARCCKSIQKLAEAKADEQFTEWFMVLTNSCMTAWQAWLDEMSWLLGAKHMYITQKVKLPGCLF